MLLSGFSLPAGHLPTPSEMASIVSAIQALSAHATKTLDQSYVSQTTFQSDTELFLPVAANSVYACHIHMIFNSPVAAGLKTQFTVPAGAVVTNWTFLLPATTTPTAAMGLCGPSGGVVGISAHATDEPGDMWGVLTTGSTAGNLQFQHAQNTSTASTTSMKAGSWLRMLKIT